MAEETKFDYGADPVSGGAGFKNPELGVHEARLRSIIHVGMFEDEFNGKKKSPAPFVVCIFELKGEEDFAEDGETPLDIAKDVALKKGDKSTLTKLMKALDPKGKCKGFDDFIGLPCNVEVKAGKKLNDDGQPMFVNAGDITEMPARLAKITPELQVPGAGHVRFEALTKEAIMELHPVIHVANILEKSLNYPGSKAAEIIAEIRKENPEFGKPAKKDAAGEPQPTPPVTAYEAEPPPDLDDKEEF